MSEKNPPEKKTPKKPSVPRQPMREQDPQERAHNFYEVALGYTEELALREAGRCLQCKKPHCMEGCPVEIEIPKFISEIRQGNFLAAARIVKERNSLPAIAGRVCPQETQCEERCVLGKKAEPCAIGRLERFVADYERKSGNVQYPEIPASTGLRFAVIGSGPAGLTVAGELIKKGVAVTVYEALHETGGVLVYGIPEFRLPKDIVRAEVDYLRKLGVAFKTNFVVGKIATIDQLLKDGYDGAFIGTGAGAPIFLNIPGENFCGVYSANEYLTRSNLMKAYRYPEYDTPIAKGKRVAVFGGGNVAMDSARTALRLGADEVIVLYRRTEAEMPARIEEVHHAKEEGVKFQFLNSPLEFLGNEAGWVKAVRCNRMRLGEPDASGRRRPIPIEGDIYEVEIDTAIVAIGNRSNPLVPSTTQDLKVNRWGNIIADAESGLTSRAGIWAGGDIVTGAATVILAMGAGRKAALDVIRHFGLQSAPAPAPQGQ
ncbi:MAG: NADPH-dependent glutamate synthase [bacterium]